MTPEVMEWVAKVVAAEDLAGAPRVLEVGSFDVNGSVRPLFGNRGPREGYFGIDGRMGPGVDVIWDIETGPLSLIGAAPFDVVVSTEMLEHTPHPWRAVENMAASLTPRGWLILTTRGPGFGLHDHPDDFYRFTMSSLLVLFEEAGLEVVQLVPDPAGLQGKDYEGVFGTGRRR